MAVSAKKSPDAPRLRLIREGEGSTARSPREAASAVAGAGGGREGSACDEDVASSPRVSPAVRAHGSGDLDGPRQVDLSDAELVALARVGDKLAFERLYRRHAPYVLALAVRIQGGGGDAEDIVHDAFLKVHDRLGELRSDDSFRFWVGKVAANLVRTRLRRRRFLGALGLYTADPVELDMLVSDQAGPEERVQLAQVYGVLQQLPVDQRLAWVLRFVEGHKLEEVAALVGCSLATVKRWISAAQARISAELGAFQAAPGSLQPGGRGENRV